MRIYLWILFISIALSINVTAQTVDRHFNTWWTNLSKVHLSEKWFVSNELHVRRTNGLEDWQQLLIRPAINFKWTDDVTVTAGYTFINNYPYQDNALYITVPENNVWEEVTMTHGSDRLKFMHRYRLEHRFTGVVNNTTEGLTVNGTDFRQRFRYRITSKFYFKEEGRFYGVAFDELWVNLNDNLMTLSFDQNWLYIGLGYELSDKISLEGGFMDQVINRGTGVSYERNPTTQLTIGMKL